MAKHYSKVSIENTEHYTWGDNCDGWFFLSSDTLSVIRETMPPHTQERLHYHQNAQQFFYAISGEAVFEVAGEIIHVNAGEGIHIQKGTHHRIRNDSNSDLHFIVISEPKSHEDRVNIESQ